MSTDPDLNGASRGHGWDLSSGADGRFHALDLDYDEQNPYYSRRGAGDCAGRGDPSTGERITPDADDTHEADEWWAVERLRAWGPGLEYAVDCAGGGA